MIETGIDGWSRGDFESGVSLGYDLRHYLPLARTAFEVAGCTLIPWLRDWMGGSYKAPLSPEGWFWAGHMPGVHVWIPPPAAALIALRQLARTRHKRPYCMTHVVLIPRILYWEEWQTCFEKEMDIWFVMHIFWFCLASQCSRAPACWNLFSYVQGLSLARPTGIAKGGGNRQGSVESVEKVSPTSRGLSAQIMGRPAGASVRVRELGVLSVSELMS